jgi:hypothetical protein
MANVHQRYAMLSERSAELSGNRGQEEILGVAFDDDDPAGEEEVRLRSVEEAAQERVVVRLAVWSAARPVGRSRCPTTIVRFSMSAPAASCGLCVVSRTWTCSPSSAVTGRVARSLKNLHEKRLMLWVQVRLRLLNQQEGYLPRLRLE